MLADEWLDLDYGWSLLRILLHVKFHHVVVVVVVVGGRFAICRSAIAPLYETFGRPGQIRLSRNTLNTNSIGLRGERGSGISPNVFANLASHRSVKFNFSSQLSGVLSSGAAVLPRFPPASRMSSAMPRMA
jgi:hypothetical protein